MVSAMTTYGNLVFTLDNPTNAIRRVACHALTRYIERHDPNACLGDLFDVARRAEFVCDEKGTAQEFWRTPDGIVLVVLNGLVKTVLPKGTVVDSYRRKVTSRAR